MTLLVTGYDAIEILVPEFAFRTLFFADEPAVYILN